MKNLQKDGANPGAGFRLRYVPETDMYQIHSGEHGAFEGPLRSIWQKMHWDFEIANSEVRYALEEMANKGHNVANFGIFGTFIFTQKD